MSKRPEHQAPPEIYYNETEARKYTQNSRIIDVQTQMAERALELLLLPQDEPCYLLDIGCGSGLSGSVLEDDGHIWVGVDISTSMIDVAKEREVDGDLILRDIGDGLPFKAGTFDGAISISTLQWLCCSNRTGQNPVKRIHNFFVSLFACLKRSSRAVFQFYPENAEQIDLITTQAMGAGFFGGLVVDYPNSTKAKKYFLVLMTEGGVRLPKGLESDELEENASVQYINSRDKSKRTHHKSIKNKDWIREKKERRRRQGKNTRPDSKFTGRTRCGKF